jgi:eukaryotic-like serine/threonine-protein kinase
MLTPDTILQNRYRVVRQLGQGGMGAVYEAIDERLDTTVALKETFFADERLRKQFEREARLLARLHHPALPRVSDHFSEGDGQFLVMQYIGGDDFAEMLNRRRGPFSTDQVLTWADQLLDALDYLHTQEPQIIHRDIKPQNLKLTSRNQIILLDFGLAKGQVGEVSRVTTTASIFGFTPNYAPLEQIQGLGTDARSDIYSLGSTIYHLLTGIKPPDALTRAAAIVNGQPDPLQPAHEANLAVDPQVANVMQRAMSQNKEQRYRSAAEMRKALEGTDLAATVTSRSEAATVILPQPTASGAPATVPMSAPATVAKQNTVSAGETTVVRHDVPPRRVPPWAIAAAVLAILGIGFGGYYAYHRQSAQNVSSVQEIPQAQPTQAQPTQAPTVQSTPRASSSPGEQKVVEQERKAATAEKQAAKSEKKANEKKSTAGSKRDDEGDEDERHDKVVVPEPYIPNPDVPTPPRGRPKIKRYGGVVIREFPDGSQLISAPNGEQVYVSPDGKRRVLLRRGGRPNQRQPEP